MININGDFCAIFVRQTKRNNKQTHNASLEEVLEFQIGLEGEICTAIQTRRPAFPGVAMRRNWKQRHRGRTKQVESILPRIKGMEGYSFDIDLHLIHLNVATRTFSQDMVGRYRMRKQRQMLDRTNVETVLQKRISMSLIHLNVAKQQGSFSPGHGWQISHEEVRDPS